MRRATFNPLETLVILPFLSTLSLRRATIVLVALLMFSLYFYPRSPCGERLILTALLILLTRFLSTLSLRRATLLLVLSICQLLDFYPRSPCGERQLSPKTEHKSNRISIHALLAESDNRFGRPIDVQFVFLSTLSLRRATIAWIKVCIDNADFYPRSPCGERPIVYDIVLMPREFLSTLSLRRATDCVRYCTHAPGISIHALLAESDGIGLVFLWWGVRFLSTLSLRRATPL